MINKTEEYLTKTSRKKKFEKSTTLQFKYLVVINIFSFLYRNVSMFIN